MIAGACSKISSTVYVRVGAIRAKRRLVISAVALWAESLISSSLPLQYSYL